VLEQKTQGTNGALAGEAEAENNEETSRGVQARPGKNSGRSEKGTSSRRGSASTESRRPGQDGKAGGQAVFLLRTRGSDAKRKVGQESYPKLFWGQRCGNVHIVNRRVGVQTSRKQFNRHVRMVGGGACITRDVEGGIKTFGGLEVYCVPGKGRYPPETNIQHLGGGHPAKSHQVAARDCLIRASILCCTGEEEGQKGSGKGGENGDAQKKIEKKGGNAVQKRNPIFIIGGREGKLV